MTTKKKLIFAISLRNDDLCKGICDHLYSILLQLQKPQYHLKCYTSFIKTLARPSVSIIVDNEEEKILNEVCAYIEESGKFYFFSFRI